MTRIQDVKQASTGLALCVALLPVTTGAQQQAPTQSFGISTGLTYNDNRGLDAPSDGDTTELFTRLDFGLVFASPLQSLSLNGDITLRALDGAEEDSIPDGLTDPNVRLRYNRAVREAALSITAFGRETETTTLVEDLNGLDLAQINENATRLTYGFDASLELGRTSPFGVTLSTGYTGLRYSNTTSTTLQDQDRTRIGASFRFDINSVLQATVGTRYRTFEEDGGADLRETFDLTGELTRALQSGSFGMQAGVTRVEEGERYSLSVSRSLETPLWTVGGSIGAEESVSGSTFGSASLNASRNLPNGSLRFGLEHSLRSGLDDDEEEFTSVRFDYSQAVSAQGTFGAAASYREVNPTGTGSTNSLGAVGVSYRHELAPGWNVNVGFNHRVRTTSGVATARDNRLSLSVRRELSALR